MKILVTGYSGLIGTRLVDELQSAHSVVTTNRNNGQRINVLEKSHFIKNER